MRAVTRSSRLSRQSNYLRMFRIVLGIAVVAFPAFGLAQSLVDPARHDPMAMRILFSATAAVLLGGTYRCEWVRSHLNQLTSGFLVLISYWYVALAHFADFSPESAVGLIVVFAAVGVGVSFWLQSLLAVSMYMLSMIMAIGAGVYSVETPGLEPAVMMMAGLGVGLIIIVAVLSREKADEDLVAQHGLLRSLFDESTDAHILFDTKTGRIIDFNQAALNLFEATEETLTDRRIDWKTGLRALDAHGPIDERAMEQRERKCKARSGRIFWADVSTHSLQVDELEITLLKVVDITEKRESARSAILEARRAAAVAELSAALTKAGIDDQDPMQIVARTVTRSQADVCIVCCLSEDGQAVTPLAVSHRNPEVEDTIRASTEADPIRVGEGLLGTVIATGESIFLDNADTDIIKGHAAQRYHSLVNDNGTYAVVVHPLHAYGKVVGAILFARESSARSFTTHDRAFFDEVVEKTGLAIANVRLLNALKRSEVRFRSLVQNSSDVILLLDKKARFSYVSPSIQRTLGYEPDDLIGKRIYSLAHKKDIPTLLGESVRVRDGKQVVLNASRFRHSNGEWRWLEALAVNMLDDASVQGVVINARDVTERIRYEEELRAARDMAEEMVRMKDAFLANMSHEIRTPLTAILGFSSVLSEELQAEHREFIGHIHKNGNRLMDALNSVLDLARLEAGGVALELSDVDVGKAVRDAVAAFRPVAADRGLALDSTVAIDATTLRLDASCLDRVLTNLLGNAIRFTEEGSVRVDVQDDGDDVLISVEDTGIGIGEDFLPHLFTPFRQESSGFARSHEGTGLGLTITRRLIELMGGRIDVESRRGVGSAFRVRFPIQGAVQRAEASRRDDRQSRAA